MDEYQNRVVEMRVMRAGDLLEHDGNPFVPTTYQREALDGDLREIGICEMASAQEPAGDDTLPTRYRRSCQTRRATYPNATMRT